MSPNKTKLNVKGDREHLFILSRMKFTYSESFLNKNTLPHGEDRLKLRETLGELRFQMSEWKQPLKSECI
jgi:hypothetical protein